MAATEGAGVATEGAGFEPDPLKWISVTLWAHKEAIVSSFLFCVTAVLYWLSLQIMTRQEQRDFSILSPDRKEKKELSKPKGPSKQLGAKTSKTSATSATSAKKKWLGGDGDKIKPVSKVNEEKPKHPEEPIKPKKVTEERSKKMERQCADADNAGEWMVAGTKPKKSPKVAHETQEKGPITNAKKPPLPATEGKKETNKSQVAPVKGKPVQAETRKVALVKPIVPVTKITPLTAQKPAPWTATVMVNTVKDPSQVTKPDETRKEGQRKISLSEKTVAPLASFPSLPVKNNATVVANESSLSTGVDSEQQEPSLPKSPTGYTLFPDNTPSIVPIKKAEEPDVIVPQAKSSYSKMVEKKVETKPVVDLSKKLPEKPLVSTKATKEEKIVLPPTKEILSEAKGKTKVEDTAKENEAKPSQTNEDKPSQKTGQAKKKRVRSRKKSVKIEEEKAEPEAMMKNESTAPPQTEPEEEPWIEVTKKEKGKKKVEPPTPEVKEAAQPPKKTAPSAKPEVVKQEVTRIEKRMLEQKEEIKALKIKSELQMNAITQDYEQRLDRLRQQIVHLQACEKKDQPDETTGDPKISGPDEVSSIVEQIDEILEDMKEKDILIEEVADVNPVEIKISQESDFVVVNQEEESEEETDEEAEREEEAEKEEETTLDDTGEEDSQPEVDDAEETYARLNLEAKKSDSGFLRFDNFEATGESWANRCDSDAEFQQLMTSIRLEIQQGTNGIGGSALTAEPPNAPDSSTSSRSSYNFYDRPSDTWNNSYFNRIPDNEGGATGEDATLNHAWKEKPTWLIGNEPVVVGEAAGKIPVTNEQGGDEKEGKKTEEMKKEKAREEEEEKVKEKRETVDEAKIKEERVEEKEEEEKVVQKEIEKREDTIKLGNVEEKSGSTPAGPEEKTELDATLTQDDSIDAGLPEEEKMSDEVKSPVVDDAEETAAGKDDALEEDGADDEPNDNDDDCESSSSLDSDDEDYIPRNPNH